MRKLDRQRKRILKELGAKVVEMFHGRNHMSYRLRTPRGPRTIVASSTPKNATIALKNFRADVERALTGNRQ